MAGEGYWITTFLYDKHLLDTYDVSAQATQVIYTSLVLMYTWTGFEFSHGVDNKLYYQGQEFTWKQKNTKLSKQFRTKTLP